MRTSLPRGSRRSSPFDRRLWLVCLAVLFVQPGERSLTAAGAAPAALEIDTMAQVRALRDSLAARGPAVVQPLATELLHNTEATYGGFSLETAEALDLLVECAWRSGAATAPETRARAERAIRIHLVFDDTSGLAESLRRMGILDELCSRLPEARELYLESKRLLSRTLGPASPRVAMASNDIGIVATRMGRFEEAIAAYREALAGLEALPAADPLEIAFVLNGLACALQEDGDYPAARAAHERALGLRTRHLPADHPKIAETLNNLGALLASMGDEEQALGLFERVLTVRRRAYGGEHPLTAAAMVNVARLQLKQGDFAAAERLYTEALRILEPIGNDPSLVSCLLGRAILRQETGQVAAAAGDYDRVAMLAAELLGPEHPYIGETLHRLALLHYETGDLESAAAVCDRAIAQRRRSLGSTHPEVAQSLVLQAMIAAERGATAAAWNASTAAEAIGRAHQEFASRALAEREALLFAGIRSRGLDLMQDLALRTPAAATALAAPAWEAVIRARAVVLDEMVQRRRAAALSQDPQCARLLGDLQRASARLANLAFSSAASTATDAVRLRAAAQARDEAERALAEKSQEFKEWQERRDLGLDAVSQALPPGDALVAYSVYQHSLRAAGTQPHTVRELAAFVLAGSQPPRLVALGPMQHVDSLVARWGFEAAVGIGVQGRSATASETAYRAAGASLRRAIWDPLQPWVAGANHIHIVPEGSLHLVNIAALPQGDPEDLADGYLTDVGVRVHVLASERDLVPVHPAPPGRGLLALGGADFDGGATAPPVSTHAGATGRLEELALRGASGPCADLETLHFEPLPGTAREIRDVAAVWGAGATVLTGRAASVPGFERQAPGKRVLHLATHGFVLGDDCAAAVAGTRGIQLRLRPRQSTPLPTDVLLQAGLALAAANRRAATPDTDDGILTAAEIATLDLQGVEWAVLSACNTGVGSVQLGEGVLGLRRAFQVAGVRSVIMSLWPVADEPTRAWMHALYEARRIHHASTVDAVHAADAAILASRRSRGESTHPFYWAGFVAAGDWR